MTKVCLFEIFVWSCKEKRSQHYDSYGLTIFGKGLSLNDLDFNGTITYREAREKIFLEELGLPALLLHSLKMGYTNSNSKIRLILTSYMRRRISHFKE